MIKRYNQFVNGRINENVDELENETIETEVQDTPPPGIEVEEEEEVEEAGDIYDKKLQKVADLLGAEVTEGKVVFNGKEIIFPSETEMFHVDRKKFKTAEEVAEYLKKEEVTTESKSYKNRYK